MDVEGPLAGIASEAERILRTLPDWFGVERWLAQRGVRFLQVKSIVASSSSAAYRETRAFHAGIGYAPLEVFPRLWRPEHPALLLVKAL